MIRINLGQKAETLRKDFESWLKSNTPPRLPNNYNLDQFVDVSSKWQAKLANERWVGVHWPEQYGGRGLTIVEEAIIQECLAKARSPQLVNLFGLTMVGPVLIKHGTEEQKQRFLKKILSAEELWCQGFSEPQAGSDLAALKTIGRKEGETWKVTGQKIWTSFAQYAAWCFVLVRTDAEVAKHKGLSYFLMPMNAQGIEVRPLKQITEESEFNELFLDDVPISHDCIVGAPGEGWKIAISTLMYERVILTFSRHLQSEQAIEEIKLKVANQKNAKEKKVRLGKILSKNLAIRLLALNHISQYSDSNHPGPEGSLDKLAWSEAYQEITKFSLECDGACGLIQGNEHNASHFYLYSRGRTIAAGTSEIQRNIIAERILELPVKK